MAKRHPLPPSEMERLGQPLAIDLFCNSWCMVKYWHYVNECRSSALGSGAQSTAQVRAVSAKARRELEEARRYQVAGASVVVVDDDAVCVERPRATGLSPVSRQGDNRLRAVARLREFPRRHGTQAHTEALNRPNRFGWQL